MLQNHHQFIAKNGSASEEMAGYIRELIRDNENKSLWIGTLMNEARSQAQVLQQHQIGQQVLAEVLKGWSVSSSNNHNSKFPCRCNNSSHSSSS